MYKPQSTPENGTNKILWDFEGNAPPNFGQNIRASVKKNPIFEFSRFCERQSQKKKKKKKKKRKKKARELIKNKKDKKCVENESDGVVNFRWCRRKGPRRTERKGGRI